MALSINKVILIGNVGRDPDVRYIDSNNVVAMFPLATSDRGYTLPNGTEVPERTEWHNIVAWNQIARHAEKYVKKGSRLYIEGKIRTRTYEDKKGQTRYVVEIMADKMEIISYAPSQENNAMGGAASATT